VVLGGVVGAVAQFGESANPVNDVYKQAGQGGGRHGDARPHLGDVVGRGARGGKSSVRRLQLDEDRKRYGEPIFKSSVVKVVADLPPTVRIFKDECAVAVGAVAVIRQVGPPDVNTGAVYSCATV